MTNLAPPREAEWALVGALMMDPDRITDCAAIEADTFADEAARAAFSAIVRLQESGETVDLITVADALRAAGQLDGVGGVPWLMGLTDYVASPAFLPDYARIVRTEALRRRMRAAVAAAAVAVETAEDPAGALATLQDRLSGLAEGEAAATVSPMMSQAEVVRDTWVYLERRWHGDLQPMWTPWPSLDAVAGGLVREEMVVVAARTSVGKSTFALQLAAHAARTGHPTLYVSYEVTPERMAVQLAAQLTGHDRYLLLRGRDPDLDTVRGALAATTAWPIRWWRGGYQPPWPTVAAVLPRLIRTWGLELVVIDHLNLVPLGRVDNLPRALADLTAAMHTAGVRHQLCIVAVDQLNRETERQSEPTLANLGWSDSIGQNVEHVWALARVDREDGDSDRWAYILKHRDGALGKVRLTWDARPTRFLDPAAPTEAPR